MFTVLLSNLGANLIIFILSGLLLAFGLFFIQKVRSAIRSQINELEEDETTRIINRQMYETTSVVTSAMYQVKGYIAGYVVNLLKSTAAVTIVIAFALTLTLGLSLANSSHISDAWAYSLLSLMAFLVGAVFSCVGNLTMFRVSSSSAALCALGATEGASEGDASQGFNATFKRMFAAATAVSVSALSLGVLAVMLTFHVAIAHFNLHTANTKEIAGIIAALVLGMSVISVLQAMQGSMVARGIDLIFERYEVDLLRRSTGALQCVGTIIGDMVNNTMLFFPLVGESVVLYLLVVSVFVEASESQSFVLAPILLIVLVMAVTVAVCMGFMIFYNIENGRSIVRCARGIFLTSMLFSMPIAYLTCHWALPETISEEAAMGTGRSNTSITRLDAFGLMVLGGATAILVSEMAEILATAQFSLVRSVAAFCDYGSPVTVVAAMSSSNTALSITCIVIVGAFYAAFQAGGFFGLIMAGLGTLLPMTAAFVISFFSHLGNNTRTIAEMSHMSHEVCEVADRVADRSNVVGAVSYTYSVVCSFLLSFDMVIALMLYMDELALSFFSTHVAAFAVLGGAVAYGFSAPVLAGIARCAAIVSPAVDTLVQKDVQRIHSPMNHDDYGDPECIEDAARDALKFSAIAICIAIFAPCFVGFLFGTDAVIALFLGTTMVAFTSSLSAATTGSTVLAVKQFVLKGGLCDASRFSQHHSAACMAASIGIPLRVANGPVLVGLVKLMGAVCIVLAPVFEAHARGEV